MRNSTKVILILVMTLFMGVIALPNSIKEQLPEVSEDSWIPDVRGFLLNQELSLGLDLQGGTQLDYIIDLRQAEEYNNDDDPENDVRISELVEGVRNTIERRVNNLGVSEPNIYTATLGDEKHIIVELAGISDIDEAKEVVGKTIQLEFKEERQEIDENEKENIREDAQKELEQAKITEDFELLGKKLSTDDGKISYDSFAQFEDEIQQDVKDQLWNAQPGEVLGLLEMNDGFTINEFQQFVERTGFAIIKIGEKTQEEREKTEEGEAFETVAAEMLENFEDKDVLLDYYPPEIRTDIESLGVGSVSEVLELPEKYIVLKLINKTEANEEVEARHILIAYQGAERSEATRSKEEAEKLAEEVLQKAIDPNADFAELAKEYSDGPSATDGGDLGFFGKGVMNPAFEETAFALEDNQISNIVETPFGFHIIQKTGYKAKEAAKYTTHKITVDKTEENAKEIIEELLTRTQPKTITVTEDKLSYERIFYSTIPDPWKETGLDGSKFVRASPTFDQFGKPLVTIEFNSEGAELFAELTERNTGKPIAIFVGGVLISAPRVNEKISGGSAQITGQFTIPEAAKLAQDLNTGAIAAPITLVGQHQVGATLGQEALRTSLLAGVLGLIVLAVYMLVQYRWFGLIANIALCIYAVILIFILKSSGLIGVPIVLTLAGIAGIILSIGMAVDANILIFERIKEELKGGKKIAAAINIGFERAWPSIRDSNISSLITCAILAWFGSSIIRGFAINLAIGILVSMFTAIVITRSFLYLFYVRSIRRR